MTITDENTSPPPQSVPDRITSRLPEGFTLEIEWGTLWIAPSACADEATAIELVAITGENTDAIHVEGPMRQAATILDKLTEWAAEGVVTGGTVTIVGWACQYGTEWGDL